MEKLLKLLNTNARFTNAQLAAMLDTTEQAVADQIAQLEKNGTLCGYKPVINWEKAGRECVTALIELKVTPKRDFGFDDIARTIMQFEEVEAVYLMSGGFDLAVLLTGRTFHDVAHFVGRRLSPLESVVATATHFVLTRYKESGIILEDTPRDERRNLL